MNSEIVRTAAVALSAVPQTYSVRRGDLDFVVFCFTKPVNADVFSDVSVGSARLTLWQIRPTATAIARRRRRLDYPYASSSAAREGGQISVRRSDHQLSVIQVELVGDPNAQVHGRANCTVRGSAFPPCGAWAIRNHQTGTAQRRGVPISHQELKGIVRTHRKGKSTDRPLKATATGVGRGACQPPEKLNPPMRASVLRARRRKRQPRPV
jgi:hypothetical protein